MERTNIPATASNLVALVLGLTLTSSSLLLAQSNRPTTSDERALGELIDQYAKARESRDTTLLKSILTSDIDQLVSTGEWRTGIRAAINGMLASSSNSPGTRTLTVEKIKMLSRQSAIVDCRYEIEGANGSPRRMWSSFLAVSVKGKWRISAIRNMLPAGNQ